MLRMSKILAHPPVVRKHKGVVKHDGCRVTLFDQHLREGQADEYGNLLLGAHAEVIECFLVSGFSHNPSNVKVFIDADVGCRGTGAEDTGRTRFSAGDKYCSLASCSALRNVDSRRLRTSTSRSCRRFFSSASSSSRACCSMASSRPAPSAASTRDLRPAISFLQIGSLVAPLLQRLSRGDRYAPSTVAGSHRCAAPQDVQPAVSCSDRAGASCFDAGLKFIVRTALFRLRQPRPEAFGGGPRFRHTGPEEWRFPFEVRSGCLPVPLNAARVCIEHTARLVRLPLSCSQSRLSISAGWQLPQVQLVPSLCFRTWRRPSM